MTLPKFSLTCSWLVFIRATHHFCDVKLHTITASVNINRTSIILLSIEFIWVMRSEGLGSTVAIFGRTRWSFFLSQKQKCSCETPGLPVLIYSGKMTSWSVDIYLWKLSKISISVTCMNQSYFHISLIKKPAPLLPLSTAIGEGGRF